APRSQHLAQPGKEARQTPGQHDDENCGGPSWSTVFGSKAYVGGACLESPGWSTERWPFITSILGTATKLSRTMRASNVQMMKLLAVPRLGLSWRSLKMW